MSYHEHLFICSTLSARYLQIQYVDLNEILSNSFHARYIIYIANARHANHVLVLYPGTMGTVYTTWHVYTWRPTLPYVFIMIMMIVSFKYSCPIPMIPGTCHAPNIVHLIC